MNNKYFNIFLFKNESYQSFFFSLNVSFYNYYLIRIKQDKYLRFIFENSDTRKLTTQCDRSIYKFTQRTIIIIIINAILVFLNIYKINYYVYRYLQPTVTYLE